jgi:hypothetical protein
MTLKLAYCDYIAARLYTLIDREINHETVLVAVDQIMASVEHPKMDLHPTEGYFQSTKKVLTVHDVNGKAYVVTVEEAPFLDKD